MEGYSEEMLAKEIAVAQALAAGDRERFEELGRDLTMMGAVDCSVCGTMLRYHYLDGWVHEEPGLDHDGRPNRIGLEWPEGLPKLGGHTAH